ncbi:Probable thiol peroxidase [Listeria grayi]|uniref:Thiol peroxidase n=3 Tax=Listeria grayi TaxID=1641 RepID=D7UYV1_LISGR|nr:thiol peroxidase [Listeria grayi]EFI83518.1 redoxin family protein [Listeria grayi DSM 20601]EUJ29778.1 lipid hydroperoxide peroxidase [Listeria grayi FSL F6-1183]STY43427.1 Probable thiol peroxidase [Listeria grayi]VEI34450.1 Probable thiol peroxidase [Listeria grayi]
MVQVTFKQKPVTLGGEQRKAGDKAPDFKVLNNASEPVTLKDYAGKTKIISVVPSIDTSVCSQQTRKFNEEAGDLENTVVLTISVDLPFAQRKWCANEGLPNAITLSDHYDLSFGKAYGVVMEELRLLARSVFVVNSDDEIVYSEYVEEGTNHPDYEKAIEAAKLA